MTTAQPSIADLRSALFATLADLRDKEKPMDLARARTVSEVAQTIINTAKVEVDYMRASGEKTASGFIPLNHEAPPALPTPQGLAAQLAAASVRTHRIK